MNCSVLQYCLAGFLPDQVTSGENIPGIHRTIVAVRLYRTGRSPGGPQAAGMSDAKDPNRRALEVTVAGQLRAGPDVLQ